MNKLEELKKQYAKLGEEIEKLELKEKLEELKKEKEEKYFMPKEDEAYYYLDDRGWESYYCENNYADKEIFERQIPCRTEEEVKFYDQKRIYETKYKKYLLDHEEEAANWKDEKQDKYYARYDYDYKAIGISFNWGSKQQGTIYTTRKESITEFAKQIGEDNFIKYILIGEYKGE